jgi:hypothetical protein
MLLYLFNNFKGLTIQGNVMDTFSLTPSRSNRFSQTNFRLFAVVRKILYPAFISLALLFMHSSESLAGLSEPWPNKVAHNIDNTFIHDPLPTSTLIHDLSFYPFLIQIDELLDSNETAPILNGGVDGLGRNERMALLFTTNTFPLENISTTDALYPAVDENGLLRALNSTVIWNGSVSTDWTTGANWTGGMAPTAADDVIIDGNYTNSPILDLTSGTVTIGSLTLGENNTSLLTISNGDTDSKKLIVTGDVLIGANGILTHEENTTVEQHKLFLDIGGNMTIAIGGAIDVSHKGYQENAGPGAGQGGSLGRSGGGAGYGGNGGASGEGRIGGAGYGSPTSPIDIGSGGGTGYSSTKGGAGGGAVKIISVSITLDGSIIANGETGQQTGNGSGGGGAGGSIWIETTSLTGTGVIAANGGDGRASSGRESGGGGGGRIALYYTSNSVSFSNFSAFAGLGLVNAQSGGAGTMLLENSGTNGLLLVDNNSRTNGTFTPLKETFTVDTISVIQNAILSVTNTHTLTVLDADPLEGDVTATIQTDLGGTLSAPNLSGITCQNLNVQNNGVFNNGSNTLTIGTNGTWYENGTNSTIGNSQPIHDIVIDGTLEFQNQNTGQIPTTFTSITINNGGILTHEANTTAQTDALNMELTTLTVNTGGVIDVSHKGYQENAGPGAGQGGSLGRSGGGAGYGGNGGASGEGRIGGAGYGSPTSPIDIGSGGGTGYSSTKGGAGGGAVKIISVSITLDGSIIANGETGQQTGNGSGGGGAGGSIWIETTSLTGTGVIAANGGDGRASSGRESGGGGGGRIALYYTSNSVSFSNFSAFAGLGLVNAQSGGAGTMLLENSGTNGLLLVDNNSRTNGTFTPLKETFTVDTISVIQNAILSVTNTHTLTVLDADPLEGDVTATIQTDLGGTLSAPNLSGITCQNLNVQNNGVFNNGSNTLTIGTNGTWYENGTNSTIGNSQPIHDIVIDGTLEFQNQNTGQIPTTFTSITINNGGILTHEANTTAQTDALNMELTTLTLNTGGVIDVSHKGYQENAGPGAGQGGSLGRSGGGAGYGGNGGASGEGRIGGAGYGSPTSPIDIGSGGGTGYSSTKGGAGGGAVKIISVSITLDGSIIANGETGQQTGNGSGGGGAGGSIWIETTSLTGTGVIAANGGDGRASSGRESGGGGGGRIALYYTSNSVSFSNFSAFAGLGLVNAQSGGAGTMLLENSGTNGLLLVDNNSRSNGTFTPLKETFTVDTISVIQNAILSVTNTHTLTVLDADPLEGDVTATIQTDLGGTLSAPNLSGITCQNLNVQNNGVFNNGSNTLTIGTNGTWYENGTNSTIGNSQPIHDIVIDGTLEFQNQNTGQIPTTFTSITINNGGILTHEANTTAQTDALNMELTTLTVNTGGVIDVSHKGYQENAGPGAGQGGSLGRSGGGAGYGGNGGASGEGRIGGAAYGSPTSPIDIGSGGGTGYSSTKGGAGGGAVKIISVSITLDGSIIANGETGQQTGNGSGGGGAGGSIWIETTSLTGTGVIAANGGDGRASSGRESGGGGGGRIALYYTSNSVSFSNFSAFAGLGLVNAQSGGAGTMLLENSGTNGLLLVDNNSRTNGTFTPLKETFTVDTISVIQNAILSVTNTHTLTVLDADPLEGDVTATIQTDLGGTLSAPNLSGITCQNLNVQNNGVFNNGSNTLTIGTNGTWYENGTNSTIGNSQPIHDIVIDGTLEFQNQNTGQIPTTFTSITINNGGILTHEANTTAQTDALNMELTTLTVNTGGVIDVSHKGYQENAGPGAGQGGSLGRSGGGAGYGGNGGASGEGRVGGAAYGSPTSPIDIGSGGGTGYSSTKGGAGGGAVKIVSVSITLDGSIIANGETGQQTGNGSGGGGAGGSIWIETTSLTGTGVIAANGGDGRASSGRESGGGGGGRIVASYSCLTISEDNLSYSGGIATGQAENGEEGTLYSNELPAINEPRVAITYGTPNIPPAFSEQLPSISTAADGTYSVYATDIDGDGDMDVLSASLLDDKIAWYENTDGAGSFGAQDVISTAADAARSVYATDIDGDGDMDVLSASNADDKIAWYENTDGAGSFGAQNVISTAADGAWSVYATDMDGDGDMDVLSASFGDDKIAWYENTDGTGTFSAQNIISTAADGAYSVYATDMDGDGDMDVLSASFTDDKIAWYENTDGAGSFGAQNVISTAADGAWSVYATDMDGDGDMDVLSASGSDDKIAWYENTDGAGTFGAQKIISTAADNARSVYAIDIDGDGDMDVLSASSGDDKIAWYENTDGAESFGAQNVISTAASGAQSVYATDVDRDGDMDVLSASFSDDKIAWYQSDLLEPQCAGNIQFNEVGGIATAWNWSTSGSAIIDDDSLQNPIISDLVDGDTVTVVVTQGNGCTAQKQVKLKINPLPVVTFGGYQYSLPITIPAANVDGPHDLIDFPLLVSVNLDTSHVTDTNGYDIIFTDTNGAALNYERESYDNASGELLAWVRIPSLSPSIDNEIKLLYGNPEISTDQSTPTAVWNSNYSGVWHFENHVNDASLNGLNGTNNGTTDTPGQIGQARNYVGGYFSGQSITLPDNNPVGFNIDQFVFSAWIQFQSGPLYVNYMGIGNDGNHLSSGVISTGIKTDNTPIIFLDIPTYSLEANNTITPGDWHYIVSKLDFSSATNNLSIYVDGVFNGSTTTTFSPDYSSGVPFEKMAFGANHLGNLIFFTGKGDEFRALRTGLSAGWIKTEYDNQLDPSAFLTIGAEEVNTTLPEICETNAPMVLSGGTPTGGVYSGTGVSLSGTDYIFDPAVSGAGTFTLMYSYSDSNSCEGTASKDIVVAPIPAAPSVSDVAACEGDFIPDLTATGSNVLWYSDTAMSNLMGAGNRYNPLITTPGVYTYYATQSTNGGCQSNSAEATLIINGLAGCPILWTGSEYVFGSGVNNAPGVGDGTRDFVVQGQGAVLPGDARVNKMTVETGQDITIPTDITLSVVDLIDNDGTVVVENNGSLVQESAADNNTGTGSYTVRRTGTSSEMMFQGWASPVQAAQLQAVGGVFEGSNPCRTLVFNASQQRWKYDYPLGFTIDCGGEAQTFSNRHMMFDDPADNIMDPGRGYFIPGYSVEPTRSFMGQVNNGPIIKSVYETTTVTPWTGDDWNLLGNPYPSAIGITEWLDANSAILKTNAIYLWDDDGSGGADYDEYDDYATVNQFGFVGGEDGNGKYPTAPVGIATGQGFYVEVNNNGTVSFDNSMRIVGNNDKFYKTQPDDNPRLWINLKNNQGLQRQTLFGFAIDATFQKDEKFDAPVLNANGILSIGTMLESTPMAIQAQPFLVEGDERIVPLHLFAKTAGVYTLSFQNNDAFEEIEAYLKTPDQIVEYPVGRADFNLDLKAGNNAGYALVFRKGTVMGTSETTLENSWKAYTLDNLLVVELPGIQSEPYTLELIDVKGVMHYSSDKINKPILNISTDRYASGIYFVKMTWANYEEVRKIVIR